MASVRNVVVFIALVGLMVGLAGVADAAHTKSHRAQARSGAQPVEITGRRGAPEMSLRGSVASVSPGTGFIVLRSGTGRNAEEIPVEIDSKTTLTRGGQRASIDSIRAGDRVKIEYSGSPGDVSKTVEVLGGTGREPTRRTRATRG